jgi:branched-chain amino acid transport system ATP-binding protein
MQFDTPIVTGEMWTSAAEHSDLIRHRAADHLIHDPPRGGGIAPFLKIAGQAEHAGLILARGILRWNCTSTSRLPTPQSPQERNIFKSLTADEKLTVVAQPGALTPESVYGMFPRLAERKSNPGTQPSGGEQQMLAVGRALVLNPKLLLLDEPLEGLAAIIVEQHPQAILKISDSAVVLDRGTVVHAGSALDLLEQPALLDRLLGVAR